MKSFSQKILLHCCCAPCSISVVKNLRETHIEPALFWYNPNIHPYTEYIKRRDCLINFAKEENLKLVNKEKPVNDEYGLRFFLKEVQQDYDCRCTQCYRMRLEKTASTAALEGYESFSTTLLISPYQNHDLIKQIGEELASKYKIDFFYRDFRSFFREGQAQAREKNIYMQKYCGCIFSEEDRYSEKSLTPRHQGTKDTKEENKDSFSRLSLLVGEENLEKLKNTSVLVFGAGGVGSWAAEALVRSGIGKIGIIDNDIICASNVNRQIEATSLTLGQPKASTLKAKLLEINPECEITAYDELFSRESAPKFNIENADFVIDAIDTMNHKLDLIEIVCNTKAKLFSSMGMALKMDPSRIKTASIWKTDVCPLARLVRQGLRKRSFEKDFTVVYSDEEARENAGGPGEIAAQRVAQIAAQPPAQKRINGSIVTVTASAGLMLASLVINDVLGKN